MIEITYRTGRVITIRDVAMKRVIEEGPPVDFSGSLVYIAGPIVKDNEVISCGPTTATRVESLIYDFVKIARPYMIVGKGPMYENMERASKEFGVKYGVFPGGCGALAAKRLRVIDNVRPELGMPESIRIMESIDFGPIAIVIKEGKNVMKDVEKRARLIFERMVFRMRFFPPEAALAAELLRRGYDSIHTCSPMSLAEAANEAVKRGIKEEPRRGFLKEVEYGIRVISLRGPEEASVRLRGEDISGEEIMRYARDAPGIIIDTGFSHLLTEKERRKLGLQINLVKGLMRRLRWEHKFIVTEEPIEGKVIYLDPSADEELKEPERGWYVIGGIVDKGNRLSGITSKLAERREAKRVKITLFGNVIGVTNTIVGIARILIYMFRGVPKDVAVLLASPRRALKHRLQVEKDEEIRRIIERLLKRRKNLTEYAEKPIETLSKALLDVLRLRSPRSQRPRSRPSRL